MKSPVSAAVLALCAAPAFGQTPLPSVAWLDLDTDGLISLNASLTFPAPRLAQFDLNGNSRSSQAEFASSLIGASKANAERSFRIFDANKDNALEQREFLGYYAFVFRNYVDTNKDVFLSLVEFGALQAAVK